MAVRPVFLVNERQPYYSVWNCEFQYNSGFSAVQKKKNISAIHKSFESLFSGKRILEISSKSMQSLGVELSAFNLTKYVPQLGRSVPVECVYQAGKVFAGNVSYSNLLEVTPREAKKDERLIQSGRIVAFSFDGKEYPTEPLNAFYDFIYANALLEHEELLGELLEYDAFTDIEFNPERSINCQARAAAVLVSLVRCGNVDKVRDFDKFAALLANSSGRSVGISPRSAVEEKEPTEVESPKKLNVGQIVKHPTFGEGTITKTDESRATVAFAVGEKTLSVGWMIEKCENV